VTGALKKLIDAPNLAALRSFDPASLVTHALADIDVGLPAAVRDDYVFSYCGDRFVESTRYVRSYALGVRRLSRIDRGLA
jgi:hypothetical protein